MTRGLTAKKLLSLGSIILLFVLIALYGIWRSRDLLFGIGLSTSGITDGMTTASPILEFSGRAKHASEVTVDREIVPLSQDGTWHDSLALMAGYNVVAITATDKFHRTIRKEYRVYYKTP